MSLADFIVHCEILPGGNFTKEDIIEELLRSLAAEGHIQPEDFPELLRRAVKREEYGSTGIGSGVAVPMAPQAPIERPTAMLALFRPPDEFDSLDGEPVDIFALILAPRDHPSARAPSTMEDSAALLRQLSQEDFRQRVRQCQTADEIRGLIAAGEGRPF